MNVTATAAAGIALVAGAEAAFRVLEPALPTHGLWYDTLPALRVQQMREIGHADVVFAGHSMVHCGVRPRTVLAAAGLDHLTGYNAGLHRGFYGVSCPFVLHAVIPALRPSVVVMGVSVFDLNDNGELLHDTVARYRGALLGRPDGVGAAARLAAGRSALFRNHAVLKRPRRMLRAVHAKATGTDVVDVDVRDSRHNIGVGGEWLGYAQRGFFTTENMRRHLVVGGLGDFHIGGVQVDAMKQWIAKIQSAGPEVVLARMRPSDALWREIEDGEATFRDASDTIRKLAADAGVALLEPQCDLVDEEHYADLAHLNQHGREIFSAALGEALARELSPACGRLQRAQ